MSIENFFNCWKAKSSNRYADQQPSLILERRLKCIHQFYLQMKFLKI
uniref:Uncharacterized protein n=1 Tax=Myoviridae sp. ctwwN25 TaxID=2825209 RepID=A0A8S5PN49_9CAUD|nr:MAG TPA: hypothetical protein [Myoviridae sp. ctwwN25]